ncbi:hypothetical protein M758_UG198300 [Ceratodon purpureus]|nr:hypothetical protein M758_UG198300 [Ceratodon purpureus]
MATWEIVVRNGVLSRLLSQLMQTVNSWDGPVFVPRGLYPGQKCLIMDVENARLASPMWSEAINSSVEWAAIRRARQDFSNEVGVLWEPYERYELSRFLTNWQTLGYSWQMSTPISSRRLRLGPIGLLSAVELDVLFALLPNNTHLDVLKGGQLEPAVEMWIEPPSTEHSRFSNPASVVCFTRGTGVHVVCPLHVLGDLGMLTGLVTHP